MTPLIRLGIRVHGGEAEAALAALLELLPDGLEERRMGEDVEYATYGESDALPDPALVRERLGPALAGLSREPVPEDWARRWHAFLGPVTVEAEGGRSVTIRPPWVPGEDGDLVVDPDVLFGAGTHPTTRLVLRLMLDDPHPGGALCDWGAGTGVLAVAAARLGWAPVTAIELDAAAAEIIAGNAARNRVAVDARAGDLTAEDPPWAPTVCAKLFRPLIVRLAGTVARPPELLLLSGVLGEEADEVAAAWSGRGLRETARLEEEEWAALRLERA